MRMVWLLLVIVIFSCQSKRKGTSDESSTKNVSETSGCELENLSVYQLMDEEGHTIYFSNLIEEDHTLLVTYTGSVCRPCLKEYFDLFSELSDGEIDKRKVVFIARYPNLRNIRIDRQESGFKVYNLISEDPCPEIPQLMEHYIRLILVNEDLEIINNRYGFPGDSLSNPDFQEIIPYLK